ncbi:MAG: hypothetical protein ACYCW6_06490 [Candidatus Xenobia bacterium]
MKHSVYSVKFWLLLPFWLLMLGALWLWDRLFGPRPARRGGRFPIPRRSFR